MGKKGKNKSAVVVNTAENSSKIDQAAEEKPEIKKEVPAVVPEVKKEINEKPAATEEVAGNSGENREQGTLKSKKKQNKKSKTLK